MKVRVELIDVPGTRLRGLHEEKLPALMDSIRELGGLIHPIVVTEEKVFRGVASVVPGYRPLAGLHRLEAYKRLGMEEIEATVTTLGKLQQNFVECDENLCVTSLTASERALFTRRRKEIYEAIHPETRLGQNQHTGRLRRLGEPTRTDRFTADTAARTGRSERDVQRDATRGERIAPEVLETVRGTGMGRGVVLDALAHVPAEDQAAELERIRKEKDIAKVAKQTAGRAPRKLPRRMTDAIPHLAKGSPECLRFINWLRTGAMLVQKLGPTQDFPARMKVEHLTLKVEQVAAVVAFLSPLMRGEPAPAEGGSVMGVSGALPRIALLAGLALVPLVPSERERVAR